MDIEDRDDSAIAARPSLGDEIFERLVDDLISLRLPPGERLSVDGLARRFGVSQTPIRNALARLEAKGLVVKKNYTGFSVAPVPSATQMRNIFELRSLIEPRAAGKAAEAVTPEIAADISGVTDQMRRLADEDIVGNCSRLVVLDSEFHRAIAAACGNAVLAETLDGLFTQMHMFRLRLNSNVADSVIHEHVEILAAIGAGDGVRAEDAMRRHIEAAHDRIEPYVRRMS